MIVFARHRVRPLLEARPDLRVNGRGTDFRFGLPHADFITANPKTTNAIAFYYRYATIMLSIWEYGHNTTICYRSLRDHASPSEPRADNGALPMPPKPPNPIDVQVGARLRMWRNERKISRTTLGEAIGLTEQQIQKYETGAHRIGASRLQKMCAVLEIPVSFLFEDALGSSLVEGGMPQDAVDFLESPEGVRFVAAFSRITDRKMRRAIARLADRIAGYVQRKVPGDVLQFGERSDEPPGM
jgi:transcriptional regulator with XRE-family HTH domain